MGAVRAIAALLVARQTLALSPKPPRRAVVLKSDDDVNYAQVAATLAGRGLLPEVVVSDGLQAALDRGDIESVFAGRYDRHALLDTCPSAVYRYDRATGMFKRTRNGEDLPRWVSLETESEEGCLTRNGWNFLTPEEPATWGRPEPLDPAPYTCEGVDVARATQLVLDEGVALVRGAIHRDALEPCIRAVAERWDACEAALGALTPPKRFNGADRFEFNEIVHRSDGRYDMILPAAVQEALEDAPWLPVVRELLGADYASLYDSCIVSVPGAKTQAQHSDNGHLFPGREHVRWPHCVTVIVPLCDVTAENGPTEFWPGSNREEKARALFDEMRSTGAMIPSAPGLELAGAVGDAIVFDTRTVHRGMPNGSRAKRPILYLAYARPWYTEGTKNFPEETLLS